MGDATRIRCDCQRAPEGDQSPTCAGDAVKSENERGARLHRCARLQRVTSLKKRYGWPRAQAGLNVKFDSKIGTHVVGRVLLPSSIPSSLWRDIVFRVSSAHWPLLFWRRDGCWRLLGRRKQSARLFHSVSVFIHHACYPGDEAYPLPWEALCHVSHPYLQHFRSQSVSSTANAAR
ncbi:MAG: hypothetical protein QOI07_3200 [Verrucomicrobiota bacterium]